MAEKELSRRQPDIYHPPIESDIPRSALSWQEFKQRAQGAFDVLSGKALAFESERAAGLLSAEFRENSAWEAYQAWMDEEYERSSQEEHEHDLER